MIKKHNQDRSAPMDNWRETKIESTDATIDLGDEDRERHTDSANEMAKPDEEKLNILRLQVLFWVFFGRYVELMIVILVTLLAIKWDPLTHILKSAPGPLYIFFLLSILTMAVLECIPALKRIPGCFLIKLNYLLTLIAFYFMMAIHLPRLRPNLSSNFAIVVAGSAATNYIFLSVLSLTQRINAKGEDLYQRGGLAIALYELIVIQVVFYFMYQGGPLNAFIYNVVGGLLFSFLFVFKDMYVAKKLVNSKKLEEFANTQGSISLSMCGSMAAFAYIQYSEEKRRVAGNVLKCCE